MVGHLRPEPDQTVGNPRMCVLASEGLVGSAGGPKKGGTQGLGSRGADTGMESGGREVHTSRTPLSFHLCLLTPQWLSP